MLSCQQRSLVVFGSVCWGGNISMIFLIEGGWKKEEPAGDVVGEK